MTVVPLEVVVSNHNVVFPVRNIGNVSRLSSLTRSDSSGDARSPPLVWPIGNNTHMYWPLLP
jgi:hypothetical protein